MSLLDNDMTGSELGATSTTPTSTSPSDMMSRPLSAGMSPPRGLADVLRAQRLGMLSPITAIKSVGQNNMQQPKERDPFAVPDGEFSVPKGTFSVPDGTFSVPKGTFSVAKGTFGTQGGDFSMPLPALPKKANKYPSNARLNPGNPAEIETYPATLPIEVALKTASVKDICEAYGLTHEDWERLKDDPVFVAEVAALREELKKDGVSFKMKARLQAEELLNTAWQLIHSHNDDVAPNVKADLIKFTIRAAGLDGSKDQAVNAGSQNALQININLG